MSQHLVARIAAAACALLLGGACRLAALDQTPAPGPAPQPGPPVPLAPRTPAGDPNAVMRRPRQITEVYEVTSADALNAKLQALLDTGMMITSVTPLTVEGKSLIIIIGMPAPTARPPMAAGAPPPLRQPVPGTGSPPGQGQGPAAVQVAPPAPAKP
jgi:hypothetical protein